MSASWDDELLDDPRMLRLGPMAFALHAAATTYCAHARTDGLLPRSKARHLLDVEGADRLIAGLVREGFWSELDEGYQLAKFLRFNESREASDRRRAEGKRRAAESYARRRSSREEHPEEKGEDAPEEQGESSRTLHPTPLPLVPSTPGMYIPRPQSEDRARRTAAKSSKGPGSARHPEDRQTGLDRRGAGPEHIGSILPAVIPAESPTNGRHQLATVHQEG